MVSRNRRSIGLPYSCSILFPQGSQAALRPNHGIDHGMHREIGIKVAPQRTVLNALANQFAEPSKRLRMNLRLQREKSFCRPVARIHRIELGHEPHLSRLFESSSAISSSSAVMRASAFVAPSSICFARPRACCINSLRIAQTMSSLLEKY